EPEGRPEGLALALVAESSLLSEHGQLDDVAPEEERDRPVDDHAQLPREERKLVQVVRARDEPPREAPNVDPRKLGDSLEAAECRDLPQHAVTVRLRCPG